MLKIFVVFLLLFVFFLSVSSISPLFVSIVGVIICLVIFTVEKKTNNNMLNPNIWFTPVFGIVQFTAVIFYTIVDEELPWFKNFMVIIDSSLSLFNSAVILGLLGFYLGFRTKFNFRKNIELKIPQESYFKNYNSLFFWSNVFLFLGFLIMLLEIGLSGSVEIWLYSVYSDSHNHTKPTYFWSQLSFIVWTVGFGGAVTSTMFGKVPKTISNYLFSFHFLSFVLPRIVQGNRHFLFALLIQYFFMYYIKNPKSKIFKTRNIIITTITLLLSLVLLGVLRAYSVGVGVTEAQLDNFWTDSIIILLKNFTYSNTTTILTISHFPQSEYFLLGKTYFASILYLLPSFLFSGERLLAHLYFQNIFFPQEQDIGFGFTLLAEAYMNFGLLGCFLITYLTALFVKYFYNNILVNKNFFNISFYTHLIYQTFWYIRADSNAYSKSLFYYAIFTILIILLSKKIKIF